MRRVTIHQRADDEWYWVFTDDDAGARLESNLTYPTFYAAGRAAAVSYPGVAVSAGDDVAVPRGLARHLSSHSREKRGLPEKAGSILAPLVVLLAWRRARK